MNDLGEIQEKLLQSKSGFTYKIRTAMPKDAKKLIKYSQEVFSEGAYLLTTAEEYSITVRKEKRFLESFLFGEGNLAIVAEHNKEIIGFLTFHNGMRKRIQHVGTLGMSVAKKYRNQGIGKAMLSELLNWAEKNPIIEKVTLEVFDANKNAIALYKQLGFVKEGRMKRGIKIDDNTYYDVILMARFTKDNHI